MIAEMSRLEIVCLRSRLDDLVAFIQEQGILHVEEVPLFVENTPGFLHRVHLSPVQKQEKEDLETFDQTLRELTLLLHRRPHWEKVREAQARLAKSDSGEWSDKVREWSRNLRSIVRQRTNLQDNIEVLRNYRQTLRNIEPLLGNKKDQLVLGENARAIMLQGDVAQNLHTLKSRLADDVGPGCEVIEKRLSRNLMAGLILYSESQNEAVGKVLHDLKIDPVEGPDKTLRGLSIDEVLAKLDEAVERQEKRLNELEEELRAFSRDEGAELVAMQIVVADRLAQLSIRNQFAQSELLAVIHGWAPSDELPRFYRELQSRFPNEVAVEDRAVESAEERKHVPTLLRNHEWVKPFEVLMALLRPPAYGSLDPTILVGFFFVMFYGFILGDAVYGLIIAGFAYWGRRAFAHIELAKHAFTVGIYMGFSSVFWGVMFGEYLGGIIPGRDLALWFYRGDETNFMFLLALGIGFGLFHVPLSLCLGIYESLRFNDTHHAQEKIGLLIGLGALGLGVLNYAEVGIFAGAWVFIPMALMFGAAVVLLVLGLGALGLIQVIEIVSLAGNVLSYARLMAVGVASVYLASSANEIAGLVPNIFGAILVGFTMHVLAIVIGIVSPAIHALRLNYVEFLPKFFAPEGRTYQPFRKEAVYGD